MAPRGTYGLTNSSGIPQSVRRKRATRGYRLLDIDGVRCELVEGDELDR